MLDNLRDQASSSPFFQQEEIPSMEEQVEAPPRRSRGFLRMTAQQRFILAVMMLVMVCLMGSMFLLITGKVVPPFLY